jgi:hypothetical protein
MGLYQELETYSNDSPLLRSPHFHCPVHRTIDDTKVTANGEGSKTFPGGYFVAESTNGLGRIAPRSKVATAAITTSSTAIVVENAMPFVAGDVLVIPVPYARLDLALTWANADVANVVIAGQTLSYTVAGYDTLTALATTLAGLINAYPAYRGRVEAIAESQYIHLYSLDGRYHTVSASDTTAGNGTLTVANSATTFQANLSVGTITTAGVDVDSNTITLASTAARRLPVGGYVGTSDKVLGLLLRQIDVANEPGIMGLCTQAEIIAANLPYYDGDIAFTLPDLKVY